MNSIKKCENLNLKNAIPIEVLKSELAGCQLANQCDMGGRYERERASAIKNILDWFSTPVYQKRLKFCGFIEDVEGVDNEHN